MKKQGESLTFKYLRPPSDELLLLQPWKKIKEMIHDIRFLWDFSARVLQTSNWSSMEKLFLCISKNNSWASEQIHYFTVFAALFCCAVTEMPQGPLDSRRSQYQEAKQKCPIFQGQGKNCSSTKNSQSNRNMAVRSGRLWSVFSEQLMPNGLLRRIHYLGMALMQKACVMLMVKHDEFCSPETPLTWAKVLN